MNQPNYIALDDIVANADQPRQTFVDDSLNELAASIKEHGVIQPLIVCENTDEATAHYPYALIAGERRLRAAKIAGLTEVPCIVRNTVPDAQTEFEMALIENIQREDLSPADEARAYQRLRTEFKLTDEQISQRVGKARSTVANTRRLAELPEAVLSIVGEGQGQLRVRDARRLIPVSRLVQPAELAQAARDIATLDADERRSIDARLGRLVEKKVIVIDQMLVDFPAKPIALATPIEGLTEMTACARCEFYLKLSNGYGSATLNCLNAACHTEKKRLFAEAELKRVSANLGIPAVGSDEQASVLVLDHISIDKVRKWVANPPAHLRLTTNGNFSRKDSYYQRDVTKSPVVFIASTQPHLLVDKSADKAGSGKVVTGGVSSNISVGTLSKAALAKETAEEKAARLAREEQAKKEQAEEARKERLADRKVRGQKRKAKADSEWLLLNTAALFAPKMPLSGSWLEFFKEFVDVGGANVNSDALSLRDDELNDLIQAAKGSARDALLREKLMLYLICDGAPWDPQDWPAMRKHVTEFITGKTSTGHLALKAPKDFDVPPAHTTEANCWTCGVFSPFDELDSEDMEAGWILVRGGKDQAATNVACPACAKKSVTRPAPKPSAAKKATAKK